MAGQWDDSLVFALRGALVQARHIGAQFPKEWTAQNPIARDAVRAVAKLIGSLSELEFEAVSVEPRPLPAPREVNRSC